MRKKTSLSQKLALVANLRDLSQADLAKKIGVQPSHLNHYLKGHGDIRSEMLLKILAEVGIHVEDLVNREIARLNSLELKDRVTPGQAMESLLKSMADEDRRALIGYVSKFARANLGAKAGPGVRALKELV